MESPWDCSNEKSPARRAHRLAGLPQALCEELGGQLRGSAEVEREQGCPPPPACGVVTPHLPEKMHSYK